MRGRFKMEENNNNQNNYGYTDNPGNPGNPDFSSAFGENNAVNNNYVNYDNQNMNGNMSGYGNQNMNGNMSGYGNQNMYGNMNGYGNQNMYGNMNGYDNQNMNGNMNSYGDPVSYAPQQPKKKKGLKIALISVIAVLVAAIVAVVLYLFLRKTPEEVIKTSVKNSIKSACVENSMYEDTLGISQIDKDNVDMEADIVVNSIYQLEDLSGAGISMDAVIEKKDDDIVNSNISYQLTIADESLGANLYCVDQIIYFEVPELCDALFKVDVSSIINELQSQMDTTGATTSVDQEELKKLYEQYMEPAGEDLKESITYEKEGKETITNHSGEQVKCKKYVMTIPTEKVRDYVSALCDYINAYADDYLEDDVFTEMNITREQFKQALQYMPTYYGMLFTRDFAFDVYVNSGKAEKIEFNYRFTMLAADVNLNINFEGDKDNITGIYGECTVSTSDTEVVVTAESSRKDTETNASLVVKVNDTEEADITYDETFDKSSYVFTNSLKVAVKGSSVFEYNMSGSFKDINKGKSYTKVIDSAKATNGSDIVYADISGEIKYGDLGKTVALPDTTKTTYDIQDLDDDTMESLINMDNAERILSAWSNALGGVTGDDYLDLDDFESYDDDILDDYESDMAEAEEEVSEYSSEAEEISDTEDYSDVVIKSDKYTIAINEPAGYERTYANDSEINIYKTSCYAYYSLEEEADIESLKSNYMSYYDYFGDTCEIVSSDTETVELQDGSAIDCYVIKSVLYESNVTDMYFFYPLQDNDYLVVDVEVWDDADVKEMADTFVNTDIIDIQ
jgi:hypothetical protein